MCKEWAQCPSHSLDRPSATRPLLAQNTQQNMCIAGEGGELPRVKPFKYTYQKEIVMYAYFKKLDYFSTECVYAPFAARGLARDFVKDLEVTSSHPLSRSF